MAFTLLSKVKEIACGQINKELFTCRSLKERSLIVTAQHLAKLQEEGRDLSKIKIPPKYEAELGVPLLLCMEAYDHNTREKQEREIVRYNIHYIAAQYFGFDGEDRHEWHKLHIELYCRRCYLKVWNAKQYWTRNEWWDFESRHDFGFQIAIAKGHITFDKLFHKQETYESIFNTYGNSCCMCARFLFIKAYGDFRYEHDKILYHTISYRQLRRMRLKRRLFYDVAESP